MALISEIGKRWPVTESSVEFDVNNPPEGELTPGDIVELHYVSDRDITAAARRSVILDVLRMKEQYPAFILHYLGFENRRIIIQYSVGAVGAKPNPAFIHVIIALGALIGVILGAYAVAVSIYRGILLPWPKPMGSASVVAKNQKTDALLANVKISVSGQTKTTGTSGQAAVFTKLLTGEHVFIGENLTGYQNPDPISDTVIADKTIPVTVWYAPGGWTPPDTGILSINTTPVKGKIMVNANDYGLAPVYIPDAPVGTYVINFGEVEGYITPDPQTKTVVGGKPTIAVGYYTQPKGEWWDKYAKWILIGGSVLIGAAVVIPEVIRAVVRRE